MVHYLNELLSRVDIFKKGSTSDVGMNALLSLYDDSIREFTVIKEAFDCESLLYMFGLDIMEWDILYLGS